MPIKVPSVRNTDGLAQYTRLGVFPISLPFPINRIAFQTTHFPCHGDGKRHFTLIPTTSALKHERLQGHWSRCRWTLSHPATIISLHMVWIRTSTIQTAGHNTQASHRSLSFILQLMYCEEREGPIYFHLWGRFEKKTLRLSWAVSDAQ